MTATHRLPNLEVPCDDSYDIIVAGGGPAGCAAAIAAAREGARTLLLEASGCLGGGGTSALVPAWCPFSDKEKLIYGGIASRVFSEAKRGLAHVKPADCDWVPIDAERLKRVYDDLVTEAGVKILFNTMLAHADTDDRGRVTAIFTANKAGLCAWRAKVFVDGTGDADLSAFAGAPFHKGNREGKQLMPATHCFLLSNVDSYGYQYGPTLYGGNKESPVYRILASGKYPLIQDAHCCNNFVGPGTVGFNAGHVFDVDNTDPASTSAALVQGRRLAAQYREALAEFAPAAFGNAFLVSTGSQIGIRETRRIIGDYELTLDDYLARRSFPDEIGRNCYFIDVHQSKEKASRSFDQLHQWERKSVRYEPGESHGIPYRCLTPRTLRNVLVAGRSIACEQAVQGSVRVMPVCLVTGEAAGMAAAHAASKDADVHAVDVDRLRTRLRAEGAYLP